MNTSLKVLQKVLSCMFVRDWVEHHLIICQEILKDVREKVYDHLVKLVSEL